MSEYIITCKDDPNDDGSFDVLKQKELVRCKDCKYWWIDDQSNFCHNEFGLYDDTLEKDFCSNGVKRGEEKDETD